MAFEKRITLGSGKLYVQEFTGTLPEDLSEMEKDDNILGLIKGGATVSYESETYTAKDDLAIVSKVKLTTETITFTSGIMTWNGKTLQKLCSTARITEGDGKRTVKIGGAGNQDGKRYVLRFVHTDQQDGDIKITIVGQATEGWELTFNPEEETVLDAVFTALPSDNEGTLIILEETIDQD